MLRLETDYPFVLSVLMLFRIEVDIGEPEKENRGKDGKWKEREKWQQEIR